MFVTNPLYLLHRRFSKARERSSKALVAIRTRATGKVTIDPRYRHNYDPVDKGELRGYCSFMPLSVCVVVIHLCIW